MQQMNDATQAKIQLAVRARYGCGCSHTGTFFVTETIDGKSERVAVEVFRLRGHPEASRAFGWACDDQGEQRYISVLGAPPIDTPQQAVRAAIASRADGSSGMAHHISGLLPGSAVKGTRIAVEIDAGRDFKSLEGYTVYRPSGDLSFQQAVETISKSLSVAALLCVDRLLVDATKLTGFPSPGSWQRFWMAGELAGSGRSLRLAVLARAELIDPQRFGVVVARNRGLFANVFTAEAEAVEWLLHASPE
jgi:hypothetical protein